MDLVALRNSDDAIDRSQLLWPPGLPTSAPRKRTLKGKNITQGLHPERVDLSALLDLVQQIQISSRGSE